MNHTELLASVRSYTENLFPSNIGIGGMGSDEQINLFIQQAERRIYNSAQLLEFRKNVTGHTTTANPYLTTPVDWMANFSLAVIDGVTGQYEFLLDKDVNFIREAFPIAGGQGKPLYYAMFDQNSYLLGPTPDADYTMELHYFYYPESIVTAMTTWLGERFDMVLLYGALVEAAIFMKEEADVLAEYKQRYDDAFLMLKQYAEGKNRQDMYRTEQVRYPVR